MSDEHFLNNWKFAVDSEGVIRDQTDTKYGNNTGSRASDKAWEQAKAAANADTPEDKEAYLDRAYNDPDFEDVREKMREIAPNVDPEDADLICTSYRVFNSEFDALKAAMAGAESDRPRQEKLAALRERLKSEDEMTGGRWTTRRQELILKIAQLHGGGR